jgi:outer membrane protein OmpA-like peptidoglycan-associated protein
MHAADKQPDIHRHHGATCAENASGAWSRARPRAIVAGKRLRESAIMRALYPPLVALSTLLLVTAAETADLPASKDPEGFRRIEGSEIIHYATSSNEQYFLARGEGAVGAGFEKQERVEGATVRVVYKALLGMTSLDIFRDYERILAELGFEETFKLDAGKLNAFSAKDFQQRFYFQAGYAARKDREPTPFQDVKNPYYLTARLARDGQTVNVAVFIGESDGLDWQEGAAGQPIVIRFGQPVIGLDVVTSKQVDFRPVEVKANDMAKALTGAGKIDIYGIYFDVDKTDLKPESRGTLEEVAKLLKTDPTLKLEVAGHTDNTGAAAHNLQLSADRAAAVVNALVSGYGIDRARLQARGYGDTKPVAPNDNDQNRARNRRVELRKL